MLESVVPNILGEEAVKANTTKCMNPPYFVIQKRGDYEDTQL